MTVEECLDKIIEDEKRLNDEAERLNSRLAGIRVDLDILSSTKSYLQACINAYPKQTYSDPAESNEDRAVRMYKEGLTVPQIQSRLHHRAKLNATQIRTILHNAGLLVDINIKTGIQKESDEDKILRLHQEGKTPGKIRNTFDESRRPPLETVKSVLDSQLTRAIWVESWPDKKKVHEVIKTSIKKNLMPLKDLGAMLGIPEAEAIMKVVVKYCHPALVATGVQKDIEIDKLLSRIHPPEKD